MLATRQRDQLTQQQNREHTASHDVPDDENLDESNEVHDTEGSVHRKTHSRVGLSQNGHLEASKKINMGSVLAQIAGTKLSRLLEPRRTSDAILPKEEFKNV